MATQIAFPDAVPLRFMPVPNSKIRRILAPVDCSPWAPAAALYAQSVAERFGASFTLIHVLRPLREVAPDAHLPELTYHRASQCMQEILPGAARANAEPMILTGDPAREIVNYARIDRSDLIVMPTHGYGRVGRLLLGSVAYAVLQGTDLPVWTGVHLPDGAPAGALAVREVLCAVDLGPESERVLLWAADLASGLRAGLRLVHVARRLDSPGEEYYAREWRHKVVTEARERMEALETHCGIHAGIELASGDVPMALYSAATRLHADLLVIGRRHGGAYDIIRQAPCPVVSV